MEVLLTVNPDQFHPLPSGIFGQFLEIPHWEGETGVEAGWEKASQGLRPDVLARLQKLNVTHMRYPGGTGIDHLDWTRFIDGAPGRPAGAGRPVMHAGEPGELGHHFGYLEYLDLAESMGWESILPVNFLDGLLQRKPLAEAAAHAAGLVAFANAAVDARLPEGMPDWPGIRAAQGRRKPWGVRLWQLGNEWFVDPYRKGVQEVLGTTDPVRIAAWYRTCIVAYVEAMRAIDPYAQFIVDAEMHDGIEPWVLGHAEVRSRVKYATIHRYAPWGIRRLLRQGQEVPVEAVAPEELWRTFSAVPGKPRADGLMHWDFGPRADLAHDLGYELVSTEWNWNGWWALTDRSTQPSFDLWPVAGIGATGFLHGLMRDPRVRFANQSMTVGRVWGITAIRVDPLQPARKAYFQPHVVAPYLYANHHGDRVLGTTLSGAPTYALPLGWNETPPPVQEVSVLDVVVSADDTRIFLHVLNRDPQQAIRLRYAGPEFKPAGSRVHRWVAPEAGKPYAGDLDIESLTITADMARNGLTVPARSVNVFVLARPCGA